MSLGDSATLRASAGTVLYLCLIALLSLGVALIVRNTGAAIATVLSLLFVFPILGTLVTEPRWREWLTEWAPMSAGLAVQATRGLDAMPVGPWQGLAVLAAYAGAALARRRHPARGPRRLTAIVSGKTVESHIANIFIKLDLHEAPDDHRRVLAVLAALRHVE